MIDVRRFDEIERVLRDLRRAYDDSVSTILARLGSHDHGGITDHGLLTGLADNDHPQYSLTSHAHDHGLLTGLADDDHTQYTRKDTLTAKGSLYAATAASTPAAVAVGSNGCTLVADSAQTAGVRWDEPVEVVSSTASATGLFTGKLLFNTSDYMLYRYDGATWLAFASVSSGASATFRHEARYHQTVAQSILNATDTKLKFETVTYDTSDVTASGTGNTDFGINRTGVWRLSAGYRQVATSTGDRHLYLSTGTATGTLSNRICGATDSDDVGAIPPTLSCSTDMRLNSGQSIFAGVFHNAGAARNTDVVFGQTIHISLTWLRP